MRTFTFKGLFLTAVFTLLGCLTIQAADDDLITKQITIKLDEAGTLPNKIESSRKYQITNLKLIGEINGTDLRMIREMAGSDYQDNPTAGKLSVLDLSEAKIVGGGAYYCEFFGSYCSTSNDVIDYYAFVNCSELTSINLPSSITKIGNYVFKYCSGLTSINIPASITKIGTGTFQGCSGLTSVTLPAGITEIGECAFYGCSGLTSLTLPAGLTQIDDYAFSECSGLTSIYVYAEKVPKIGEDVFTGCDAKKCTVYVPKGTYDDYWLSDFRNYFENIVEFDATGIDKTTTSTDVEEVSRYSVNGQRLVGPTKGLNIVKYSDGSVKKVAVE
mgnify:CR=1 FL=1